MVLEDASPQAPDSTSDYFSSDSNSPFVKYHALQIKPELVTHPDLFTLYFGFFGKWNWKRKFTNNLAQRIENARVLVQRTPTQDELDAFVAHTSSSVYHQRMGAPLGFLLGSGRLLIQATKSDKFPLYAPGHGTAPVTPRMLFEAGRNFFTTDPLLAKQMAKLAGFKLFMWTLAGSAFSSVFAVWLDTTNTMTDPRLKQFVADVRSQNPEEVRRRKMEAAAERARPRSARHQQEEVPVIGLEEGQEQAGGFDGFSGSEQREQEQEGRSGYGTSSGWGDTSSRSSDQGSLGQTYGDSEKINRRPPPLAPSQEQSRQVGFFDDEDDASPTAPEYRKGGGRFDNTSATGSVWERLRQQNQGSAPSQTNILKPSSRPLPPQSESWGSSGSSSAGNDSQQEREQAQAEFDRLIESERNISSDPESGKQGRGWGKWS